MFGLNVAIVCLTAAVLLGNGCHAAGGTFFYLFRRTEPKGTLMQSLSVPANFDRNKPTYVLLHGMGGSHNDRCMQNIQNAILQIIDGNVIIPDYQRSAYGYTASFRNIAREVNSFLTRNGINPSNTMAIGQSLGAQVAGILHQYGFKPSSIIAMDPAGPQFNSLPSSSKLSPSSANSVQVIHTNAGGLGTTTLDGTLDVFINGGNNFPCCTTSVCRHIGACHWVASTIRNGPTSSATCSSQSQAVRGTCQGPAVPVGYGSPARYSTGRTIAHLSLNQCFN